MPLEATGVEDAGGGLELHQCVVLLDQVDHAAKADIEPVTCLGIDQIDLLDIPWFEKWDIVFLLDVLEHIPEHQEALKQIRKCMRPGGLLFITTPALKFFWTYNDDVVHHQRRYSKKDF